MVCMRLCVFKALDFAIDILKITFSVQTRENLSIPAICFVICKIG